MPRPAPREMPGLDELYATLDEGDAVNVPQPEAGRDRELASLLAFAVYFTERQKRVEFPEHVAWGESRFEVVDAKMRVPVKWAHLDGLADLQAVVNEAGFLAAMDQRPFLLALDCLDAEGKEFEYLHALYGEPAVIPFRHNVEVTRESRIPAARAAGWTPTLKEHNLLPGRSLYVPDDAVGLYLTEATAEHLLGVLLLLPDGNFSLCLNPFARKADADLQYWLSWGMGEAGTEWKEVLNVDEQPDFGYHGALHEPVDGEEDA